MSAAVNMRLLSLTIGLAFVGLTACTSTQNQAAQNPAPDVANGDPANGNLAPVSNAPAEAQNYPPAQSSAPAQGYAPDRSYAPAQEPYSEPYSEDASYQQTVQAPQPPPPLPEYSQPPCPEDNDLWTPGYWDYSTTGYYWVPGAWVVAPWVGSLWTPPYWGYENGSYIRHAGYWGPHIGFYGGINYGFGYTGRGYYGAYWNHGSIEYNRTVTNVNTTIIHNVYEYKVPESRGNRISYNGGRGGIEARPTAAELAVRREPANGSSGGADSTSTGSFVQSRAIRWSRARTTGGARSRPPACYFLQDPGGASTGCRGKSRGTARA